MKQFNRFSSFLAGAATALALTVCLTTALAASGKVSYNFANVSLNGTPKITAGKDITAANWQKIPGSILYTDAAGGKTNYLPIRTISELLEVEIGYDSASKTILLKKQGTPGAGAAASGVPMNARMGDKALILSRGGTILPDDNPDSYWGSDKVFKDKDGELRFEYMVGNKDALDSLDKKVADKHLENGDYPKNSRGEHYGPAQLAYYVGYVPDLCYVAEEGDHPAGYIRQSERSAEDAKYTGLSKEECPHTWSISLYDSEGKVIGKYPLGCAGHFYTPGMTLEEVQASMEEAFQKGEW